MKVYSAKLKTAIQKVFQDMNSLSDTEFFAEIEKYKDDGLTVALSKATYEKDFSILRETL